MHELMQRELQGAIARIVHSSRSDGDLSPSQVEPAVLAQRRHAAVPLPWHAVHQVHSDRVHVVDDVVPSTVRPIADALTTSLPGVALAVHSGDCVPVGLIQDDGQIAVAHAGWKGLEAGVLESTVRQLRSGQAAGRSTSLPIAAAVGPHIRAAEYEFGEADLERLARRFGDQVIAATAAGAPALDLTAALAYEFDRLEVDAQVWSPDCTAAQADKYWSHRARREPGRLALVAWIEASS